MVARYRGWIKPEELDSLRTQCQQLWNEKCKNSLKAEEIKRQVNDLVKIERHHSALANSQHKEFDKLMFKAMKIKKKV